MAANLPSARGDASAISLNSGVAVFGGVSTGTTASNSVLLLNPASNLAASSQTVLNQARAGFGLGETHGLGTITPSADTLAFNYNGDVFVYGGAVGTASSSNASASMVNYTTGDEIAGPAMLTARAYFGHATDPATGDLYAIGGLTATSQTLASAERYDPTTNAWSAIAPLPIALSGTAAATDGAGHVFVFGGKTSAGAPVASVYRYTIATDSWDSRAALPVAVTDATAVYGSYGTIYVAGGKATSEAVRNFEIYNPVFDTFTAQTPLPSALYGAAGAIDFNSNLDLIGGFNSNNVAVATVEQTPATPSSVALPQPPVVTVGYDYFYYDGTSHGSTATAVGTDGATPVAGTFTFTYNGSTTPPTAAGSYNVIARFTSADPGYVDSAAAGSLYIGTATPTLKLTGAGTFTYNGQPHPIIATVTGIDGHTPVAGTFSYTYNGSATPPTTWGTYTAVATFTPSDTNYTSATSSTTVTIPDPRIPTNVVVAGTSTTSIKVTWSPVTLPTGAVPTYNLIERIYHPAIHNPKGSGGTPAYYTYSLLAGGLTGTRYDIGGLATASSISGSRSYVVTSVDNSTSPATQSPYSAVATGSPLYAPNLSFALWGGAVTSQASVEIGHSVQITPLWTGNEAPRFTLTNAPASMSIDPVSGTVTYSPVSGESGTITVQITGTNSLGSSSEYFTFVVIQQPVVHVTGGVFAYDGNVHAATAVALGTDGLPVPGTFTFQYAPVQYPTSYSSSPYAQAGTYNVLATFNSSVAGYGTATGTATLTINPAGTQTIAFTGSGGYLKLDPNGTGVDVWNNATATGSIAQVIDLNTTNALSITGTTAGLSLTIDLSAGNLIPAGGLSFIGNGILGGNSLKLVGTASGNDQLVASNQLLLMNSQAITFADVGQVLFSPGSGTDSLEVDHLQLTIPSTSTAGIQTSQFSSISLGPAGSLVVASSVNHSNRTLIDTGSLTMDATATLDMGSNDLVVQVGDLTAFSNQMLSGAGLFSSAATSDSSHLTILGIAANTTDAGQLYGTGTALGLFDGQNVPASAVIIKYTYFGDTNLDGRVDGTDYSRIDAGYVAQAAGGLPGIWFNGDLNGDQLINGSDYTLIDNAYNTQGASLATKVATPAARFSTANLPMTAIFSSTVVAAPINSHANDLLSTHRDVLDQLFER